MAQRSLTRAFAKAVDAPLDGLVRLVPPAVALMLVTMAISFVAVDKPSPLTNLLSTVTEWTGSQPSTAGARHPSYRLREEGSVE